jgi:ABC-type Fe3+ transport system permease subunit
MFSPTDLQTWEIVATSGVFAVVVLALAAFVGTVIAYLVVRHEAPDEQTTPVRGVMPADVAATERVFPAAPTAALG